MTLTPSRARSASRSLVNSTDNNNNNNSNNQQTLILISCKSPTAENASVQCPVPTVHAPAARIDDSPARGVFHRRPARPATYYFVTTGRVRCRKAHRLCAELELPTPSPTATRNATTACSRTTEITGRTGVMTSKAWLLYGRQKSHRPCRNCRSIVNIDNEEE